MKKFSLLLGFVMFTLCLAAQDQYVSMFWYEGNFSGPIGKSKKWQYQVDHQYRRNSDFNYTANGDYNNIFKNPYQHVLRPWIHYWIVPGQLRFSLSPIGFWETWTSTPTLVEGGSTVNRAVFPEFRICPQITTSQSFGRVQFVTRWRYEFRFIGEKSASSSFFEDMGQGYDFTPAGKYGSDQAGRLRCQVRMQIPLNKPKIEKNTLYLNTWDELFLGAAHVANNRMLNQNRLVGLLGYKLNSDYPVKIEAGLTYAMSWVYKNSPSGAPAAYFLRNNAFTVYLIFDDFHAFMKKKEKPVEK